MAEKETLDRRVEWLEAYAEADNNTLKELRDSVKALEKAVNDLVPRIINLERKDGRNESG